MNKTIFAIISSIFICGCDIQEGNSFRSQNGFDSPDLSSGHSNQHRNDQQRTLFVQLAEEALFGVDGGHLTDGCHMSSDEVDVRALMDRPLLVSGPGEHHVTITIHASGWSTHEVHSRREIGFSATLSSSNGIVNPFFSNDFETCVMQGLGHNLTFNCHYVLQAGTYDLVVRPLEGTCVGGRATVTATASMRNIQLDEVIELPKWMN